MKKTSYVVLEKTPLGVKVIRHPYASLDLAKNRACTEAAIFPGKTFYVFESVAKYCGTMKIESEVLR